MQIITRREQWIVLFRAKTPQPSEVENVIDGTGRQPWCQSSKPSVKLTSRPRPQASWVRIRRVCDAGNFFSPNLYENDTNFWLIRPEGPLIEKWASG
jgi:hypothetical protein